MRRVLSFIGILALTGASPSCSTIDLSHLGKGVVAPPREAGTDALRDAGTDAPLDAATDASLECPAGAFCQDFDESVKPEDGFTKTIPGGVTLTLTSDFFHSPLKSLLAELESGRVSVQGFLVKEEATLLDTKVTAKASIRIERHAASGAGLLFVESSDGLTGSRLTLTVSDTEMFLRETTNDESLGRSVGSSARPWPIREWVDVRLTIDRLAQRASLFVAAEEVLANVSLSSSWDGPAIRFGIGIESRNGFAETAYRVHFDDIVLETR